MPLNDYFQNDKMTIHFINERQNRIDFIDKHDKTIGRPIQQFIEDKGHKKGIEIHTLTDTGLLIVRNKNSDEIVTIFYLTTERFLALYESIGLSYPKKVFRRVVENEFRGWCNIEKLQEEEKRK